MESEATRVNPHQQRLITFNYHLKEFFLNIKEAKRKSQIKWILWTIFLALVAVAIAMAVIFWPRSSAIAPVLGEYGLGERASGYFTSPTSARPFQAVTEGSFTFEVSTIDGGEFEERREEITLEDTTYTLTRNAFQHDNGTIYSFALSFALDAGEDNGTIYEATEVLNYNIYFDGTHYNENIDRYNCYLVREGESVTSEDVATFFIEDDGIRIEQREARPAYRIRTAIPETSEE